MNSFIIKKYTSSGTWSGETYSSHDSIEEAQAKLSQVASAREQSGYNINLKNNCLEVSHDSEADASTYVIYNNSDQELDG